MALVGGLVVAGAGSIASLVVRYRRSACVQRQQLKVIAVGGAAAITGIMLTLAPTTLWPALVLLLALPGAVGVAILRYRLFEIDRLISRTVSYLLLTGLLAAVYAVGVVGLRDAVLVVEQFSGRLRDQLELDQLNDELVAVVTQTVSPARVAVWLTQEPRVHAPG